MALLVKIIREGENSYNLSKARRYSLRGERERGGTENILSAVVRRGDDSVNTTIFLDLILVIVGETFKL